MKNLIKLFLVLSIISTPVLAKQKQAFIRGFDSVITPDDPIKLDVKIEKFTIIPFLPNLSGVGVQFFKGKTLLGTSLTRGSGHAHLTLEPGTFGLGTHKVHARIMSTKYAPTTTSVVVSVLNADTPIIISDIDHTLAKTSFSFDMLFSPVKGVEQLEGAKETIDLFANEYEVIYLTAREDIFTNYTKNWLDHYEFIKAPVYLKNVDYIYGGTSSNSGKYKEDLIKELKLKFDNILIGFGDKPHDVVAYRKAGLRAYYIGESDAEEIHPESIQVNSWHEIWQHYINYPMGSLESDPK